MAEKKTGRASTFERLSPVLATFRLQPEDGSPFPDYKAGQYMALSRADCKLTKRVVGPDGKAHYQPDLDESGQPRRGTVTHSYSIASAPWETRELGHLEYYIVLEIGDQYPGRLTESFFRMEPGTDDVVGYVNRIAGDFTLDKRAAGARNVVMVGTGTGLAPFVGMVKELDQQARTGLVDSGVRYTLFHANRTTAELAYHRELMEIEDAARFDFCYVATVSRPEPADGDDSRTGTGRANNVLRHVLGLPLREEEEVAEAAAAGGDVAAARRALERAVVPTLPPRASLAAVRDRLEPATSVILTCGNPTSMADIKRIAEGSGIRYEKEDWKVVLPSRA